MGNVRLTAYIAGSSDFRRTEMLLCKPTFLLVIAIICSFRSFTIAEDNKKFKAKNAHFPDYFKFGVSSSSYQIEGAWNVSGKSPSIWDYGVHEKPSRIADRSNGDVACDSYHKLKEDIEMLKQLHVDAYRFSISWPRIFPLGYATKANPDGVRYYNELIDNLIDNNIEPVITLYHWELPQILQDLNGWTNPILADIYVSYADKIFELFGDKVKTWFTFNEPANHCVEGYKGNDAPFLTEDGIGTYLCVHTILRAHAKTYRMYQKKYKSSQKGKVGIVLDSNWYEPFNASSAEDKEAAERYMQMYFGWTAHPIFSQEGDYPKVMRDQIAKYSKIQSFTTSRLPEFTADEIEEIKGSSDLLGLNHYTVRLVTYSPEPVSTTPSFNNDLNVTVGYDPSWEQTASPVFVVTPFGIRKVLNWISKEYGNDTEISITENGYAGYPNESLDDIRRVNYLRVYLKDVLQSIKEGINVTSYFYWSLMDNFEWSYGYTVRYGLYHVDFTVPNRTRTPKASAFVYENIIRTRTVNESYYPWDMDSKAYILKENIMFTILFALFVLIFQ